MRVYPNPNNGFFMIKFNLKSTDNVKLTITDVNGKTIESGILEDLEVGENTYTRKYRKLSKGGVYFITLETPYEKAVRKLVVEL
jgi:flagellar hook assembly protein FlgD